jgi:uncharacterized membrane protein
VIPPRTRAENPGAADRSGARAGGADPSPGQRPGTAERTTDVVCRAVGSWAYLALLAAGITVAAAVAVPGGSRPVALVGLGVSALAAVEVPIVLMAGRRAERIAADVAHHHLDQGRRVAAVAEELRVEMRQLHDQLARIAAQTEIARGSTQYRAHP